MGSMGVHFEITEGLDKVWGYDGTFEDMRKVIGLLRLLAESWSATSWPRSATRPASSPASRSRSPRCSRRRGSAGWTRWPLPEEEIRQLPHRTLIVHGREDKVIPLANSYKLEELLDNADLSVFSHCGHWSMIERTADFNRLVRDFFLGVLKGWWPCHRRRGSTAERRRAGASGDPWSAVSDRDPALLRRIYETMVLTRAVEDRMVAMYKGGDLLGSLYTGHWHEAISVGAASTLRPDDYMAPIHRDLGAHLCRGMEPWQVMASFMGKATSPTGGRDGTLHYGRLDLVIYNLPSHIPANFPVATGMAFAAKYRGQDRVCLAFCGDGSTSRADFHEALTMASVAEAAEHLRHREQPVRLLHPDLRCSRTRRRSPTRRSPTAFPGSRSTAPTRWPCTTRSPRRWPGPGRARVRRSSRA